MLDSRLEKPILAQLRTLSVDWRDGYAGVSPQDGAPVAWPASHATAAGLPLVEATCPLTIDSPIEPLRVRPSHQAEMISELRGGEWLTGILQEGDWWLVAGEDSYVGWVHGWVVSPQTPESRRALASRRLGLYARPHGTMWISDHTAASVLTLGTPLLEVEGPAPRREGFRLVATPWGAEGWLPEEEIRMDVAAPTVRDLLNVARSLLGVPYRWGGRSPLGFDCSGFVQSLWQWVGIALPRDASQQQRCGAAVDANDPERWEAGDLLFLGDPADHVGVYDGRGAMIHCSGWVRREKLSDIPHRLERLSTVRRLTAAEAVSDETLWRRPPRSKESG